MKIDSEKKYLFRFCLFSELAHYPNIIEYSLSTEAVFKNFWCFAYMYDCSPCAFPVPIVARKGIKSPATAVVDNYEPPCVRSELNLGHLEEELVL